MWFNACHARDRHQFYRIAFVFRRKFEVVWISKLQNMISLESVCKNKNVMSINLILRFMQRIFCVECAHIYVVEDGASCSCGKLFTGKDIASCIRVTYQQAPAPHTWADHWPCRCPVYPGQFTLILAQPHKHMLMIKFRQTVNYHVCC